MISAAVEGVVDNAVVTRLIQHVGGTPGPVFGRNGKPALRQRIKGYASAARFAPWIVLVDLDHDFDCAPPMVAAWVDHLPAQLCFRVVVREIESWLLADRARVAAFLGIAALKVPNAPESVDHPKRAMVELAKDSKKRDIRLDLVPVPGSHRTAGPGYSSQLADFARRRWRPDVAATVSPSLARAIECLRRLASNQS